MVPFAAAFALLTACAPKRAERAVPEGDSVVPATDTSTDTAPADSADSEPPTGRLTGDLDLDAIAGAHRVDAAVSTAVSIASAAGDVDGDGVADLLIAGGDESAWLWRGPIGDGGPSGPEPTTQTHFVSSDPGRDSDQEITGVSAGGDVDGDGLPDVVLTSSYGGGYLYTSGLEDAEILINSATTHLGATTDRYDDSACVDVGDLDGDGIDEVALGVDDSEHAAFVYAGPLAPGDHGEAGDIDILQTRDRDIHPTRVGDIDGDGLDDLALSGTGATNSGDGPASGLWIFTGGSPWSRDLLSAAIILDNTGDNGAFGTAVASGDFDGDGSRDLVVSAPGGPYDPTPRGAVYLQPGPVASGAYTLDVPALEGTHDGDRAGYALSGGEDLDGDGRDDLVVASNPWYGDGAVDVVYGPMPAATTTLYAAGVALDGSLRNTVAVALTPDVTGDGRADLVVQAGGQSLREETWVVPGGREMAGDDLDRDHSAAPADCDDADAAIRPGAVEGCGDAVDQDCDGDPDASCDPTALSVADAVTTWGDQPVDADAGERLADAGDLDGDGLDDLIIAGVGSGEGTVAAAWYVITDAGVSGPRSLTDAAATLEGTAYDDGPCDVTAAGDLTGDGVPDVIAHGQLYAGPVGGVLGPDALGATSWASDYHPLGAHDVDGDGAPDLVLAAGGTQPTLTLYAGPLPPGRLDYEAPAATLRWNWENAELGTALAAGDLDGDGVDDLAVAATSGIQPVSMLYTLAGPLVDGWLEDEATATLSETHSYDGFAAVVIADLDGDGLADLTFGAPGIDTDDNGDGAVFAFLGGAPVGAQTPEGATFRAMGSAGSLAGSSLSVLPGGGDGGGLLVGGPGDSDAGASAGNAWALNGPLGAGTRWLVDADAHIIGEQAGDALGTAVVALPDLDGDGLAELYAGAPGALARGPSVYRWAGP